MGRFFRSIGMPAAGSGHAEGAAPSDYFCVVGTGAGEGNRTLVFSLEVSGFSQCFQEPFLHFAAFGRLRSLRNFSLSEWRLPPAYLNSVGVTTIGRSSAENYFCRDRVVDRTDRPSNESEPPPLLRMKRSSALTRGIFKRSMGTIALIQRSGTGKSGSGTTREPPRISGGATKLLKSGTPRCAWAVYTT